MKKLICVILSLVMILSLTACASSDEGKTPTGCITYSVAIVQQLDHSSLDEIRTAIEAQLKALGEKSEIPVVFNITYENGQNDASMLNQIGTQVVSDGVDMIIPIATTAAQCMVTAADGTDIPTVTGVSDALNTNFIMDMMFAADPSVQSVGLLYSNSEINSEAPIRDAKAYLDAKGISYVEKTGNTANEVIAAASDLVGRVDAVFTPTDNVVMATEAAVAELLNEAGIPHYTGADSFVTSGAFATCGVNYTELGTKTADIAFEILQGGAIGDFHIMDGGIITVNTETAQMCGMDYSAFATMANTVNEVVTAE